MTSILFLSACGSAPPASTPSAAAGRARFTTEPPQPLPTITPLPGACRALSPAELNDFTRQSITARDTGKTFVTHVTSRFWIYLDDRIYPIDDLMKAIPEGLLGTVSNGSIRGPHCYPVMFEAVKEGQGLLSLRDFQLAIIVDDRAPESKLPLP